MLDIEFLGRQAIKRIKSEWGLPECGLIAGGSISNIVWELVSGTKAIVNDVDVFVFDSIQEKAIHKDKDSIFNYREIETTYFEDYSGIQYNTHTKDFYSIVESTKDGIFNTIKYKSNSDDPSIIIKSFDINSTKIGYSIERDEIYWSPEFEEFLNTGELKVCNLMTPSHTAIRIAKKSVELNAKLDNFEFKLLKYALYNPFIDKIKFRFMDRYLDIFDKYSNILFDEFSIDRDENSEIYVKGKIGTDVKLYYLVPKVNSDKLKFTWKIFDYVEDKLEIIFGHNDSNVNTINKSTDFLFYMRNIYGDENLKNIWKKTFYFFKDMSYVDKQIGKEDLELLSRLSLYAPKSIENLKGLKISEQIEVVKMFFEKYKEDPIVAISILEKFKVNKDIVLDADTSLIFELSVRKEIVNDTRGKVNRIVNDKEEENKTTTGPYEF